MKPWLTLFVIGVSLFLGGCFDGKAILNSLVKLAPNEEAIGRKFIEDIVNGRPQSAVQYLLPELQNTKSLERLSMLSFSARGLQLKNIELVNIFTNVSLTPEKAPDGFTRKVDLTYQLEYATGWNLTQITVEQKNGKTGVATISAQPMSTSLQNLNRFSLLGRTRVHYFFLLLAICVPLFCIVAFVICVQSRVPMKWFWAIFILLGFGTFNLNWTAGQTGINPLSVQLLGGGLARSGFYSPWIIGWSLPLGAVLFLLFRKRLLKNEPPQSQPIANT